MAAENDILAALSADERSQLLEPLKKLVASMDVDPEQIQRR
jgi:hypothetical protein